MSNNKKQNSQNNQNNLGFFGKITKTFLDNKELSILVIIALFFFGLLSFIIIPKQYNPKIVAPAFNIITEFPGASSEEVYELITRPMENKLREIPEVDKVMSSSYDGGRSIVTVQFYIGEDLEDSKITLIQKFRDNMDLKPLGVEEPMIKLIDPENVPIISIALSSETLSEESLRKLGFDLKERLKQVENTAEIAVIGGRKKELIIELDLNKLNAYNLSPLEIINQIQSSNQYVFLGHIKDDENKYNFKINSNLETEADLADLILKNTDNGPIYLKDIAQVSYQTREIKSYTKFSDKQKNREAVYVTVAKSEPSNATTVSAQVLEKFEELKEDFIPKEVQTQVVRNDGQVASEEIKKLTTNLLISIAIVSFILFLFLGWRSALIVSISIPLTLFVVFFVGLLNDQTINRITLFALILSLGLLVDSATVVVENIFRFFREKAKTDKKVLIAKAVNEVGKGLLMSTVTTILAFYPMAFVTGMMGPYMGPIPFFVPAALIISFLIAISINPFLASILVKDVNQFQASKKQKPNFFLRLIEKIKARYVRLMKKLLSRKRLRNLTLIITFAVFFITLSFPLFKIVKFRMLPKADKEQFFIYLDLEKNASIKKTAQISQAIEGFLLKDPEVKSVQSFIGRPPVIDFNGLFKGAGSRVGENQATFKINLTSTQKRDLKSEEIVVNLRKRFKEEGFFNKYPDLKVKFIEDPPGPPVQSTYLVKIQGEDLNKLYQIAKDFENQAKDIKGIVDLDNSIPEENLEYFFKLNKEKVAKSGLNSAMITNTLYTLFKGSDIALYHEKANKELRKPEQEFIHLILREEDRNRIENLNNLFIKNYQGEQVPLVSLLEKEDKGIPSIINSDEKRKTVYLSGEMKEESVTYAVIDSLIKFIKYKLPSGQGKVESFALNQITYRDQATNEKFIVKFDGEWKLTLDVFRDLGIAMAAAVFLIYFVLVVQFKSFKEPILIIITIPLAMIGVMPGFAILGKAIGLFFNATSMIGVIALSGIVVNNAIILLEYINDLKKEKKPLKETLIEAGETRLLPILLTSMTTILGSLTIISDPVWAGLAFAILFGLSLSSFLTLIIFPLLYFSFMRKKW
jgi:multidrug efflux pump subunit AcrB